MSKQPLALQALSVVDFDWTMHMKSVWRDAGYDIDTLHQSYRHRILAEVDRLQHLRETNSPPSKRTSALGCSRRCARACAYSARSAAASTSKA